MNESLNLVLKVKLDENCKKMDKYDIKWGNFIVKLDEIQVATASLTAIVRLTKKSLHECNMTAMSLSSQCKHPTTGDHGVSMRSTRLNAHNKAVEKVTLYRNEIPRAVKLLSEIMRDSDEAFKAVGVSMKQDIFMYSDIRSVRDDVAKCFDGGGES